MKRFALIGAAGYIAPRHMKAIAEVGGELVAALDPHDSVGVLDSWAPRCEYYKQPEVFERRLEKLRHRGEGIDYLVVCSPNWLHDAHCRMGMRAGADVICEKPVVINPANLDELELIERETGQRVWGVMQMRLSPHLRKLRHELQKRPIEQEAVDLLYVAPRGKWYEWSWKGDPKKSGGLAMNIGVHLFDLLVWLFGGLRGAVSASRDGDRLHGLVELEWANVMWMLSTAPLTDDDVPNGRRVMRLVRRGQDIDLSRGFRDLHTQVYREILDGKGIGLSEARPGLLLVDQVRKALDQ